MGSKGNRPSHPVAFVLPLINSILARKIFNREEELPKPTQCQPTVSRRGYQQVTDKLPTGYRQFSKTESLLLNRQEKGIILTIWFQKPADCCSVLWPKPTVVWKTLSDGFLTSYRLAGYRQFSKTESLLLNRQEKGIILTKWFQKPENR